MLKKLKKLPTRKFVGPIDETVSEETNKANDDKEEEQKPSCAICMQNYKNGDELRILPCQHDFHIDCVDKWLPLKKVCPLCRHDITKQPTQAMADNNQNNQNNHNNNNNNNNNNDPILQSAELSDVTDNV